MIGEQSDREDNLVGTEVVPVDDETAETEVEFRQPCGSEPGPDQMPKDIPVVTGAIGAETDMRDPGQTCRLGSPKRGQTKTAPVWVANPANYGITQAAAGCRDTDGVAGDRPVRIRNADPDVSGTGQAADRCRNTTDDRPVYVRTAAAGRQHYCSRHTV